MSCIPRLHDVVETRHNEEAPCSGRLAIPPSSHSTWTRMLRLPPSQPDLSVPLAQVASLDRPSDADLEGIVLAGRRWRRSIRNHLHPSLVQGHTMPLAQWDVTSMSSRPPSLSRHPSMLRILLIACSHTCSRCTGHNISLPASAHPICTPRRKSRTISRIEIHRHGKHR